MKIISFINEKKKLYRFFLGIASLRIAFSYCLEFEGMLPSNYFSESEFFVLNGAETLGDGKCA